MVRTKFFSSFLNHGHAKICERSDPHVIRGQRSRREFQEGTPQKGRGILILETNERYTHLQFLPGNCNRCSDWENTIGCSVPKRECRFGLQRWKAILYWVCGRRPATKHTQRCEQTYAPQNNVLGIES